MAKNKKHTIDNGKISVDPDTGAIGVEGMPPITQNTQSPKTALDLTLPPSTEEMMAVFTKKIDTLSEKINSDRVIEHEKLDPPAPENITPTLLKDAVEEYVEDRIKKGFWRDKRSQDAHKTETAVFLKIVGNVEAHKIPPASFRKYQNSLWDWPNDYNKTRHGNDVEAYKKTLPPNYTRIIPSVVRSRNRLIQQFLQWCKDNFIIEDIRLPKIKLSPEQEKAGRQNKEEFNESDLKIIFSHKIFTQHKYQNDGQFFIPCIMLWTGMRSIECCQIRKVDLKRDDDYGWYLSITNIGDKQSVKTESSKRQVPIHQDLIDQGFLDFIHKTKTEYLFPVYAGNERAFQKGVNERMLPSLGIKTKSKSCHSFRRSFGYLAEKSGVRGSTIDKMRGHIEQERAKMAETYKPKEQLALIAPDYHENFKISDNIKSQIIPWNKTRMIKNNLKKRS